MPTLRLLSINARTSGGRDGLVRLIGSRSPDLVAVHGAPHLVRWRQAVGSIARRSGLVVVSGGGRQAGGTLLLSSLGVDVVATRDVRFTGAGGLSPAGATVAAMSWRGHAFTVTAATLIGNSAVRLGQARELQAAIDALTPAPLPGIVSAEGTDRPGTAAYQELVTGRASVVQRLFADPRITVEAARMLDGHPFTAPAEAELRLD